MEPSNVVSRDRTARLTDGVLILLMLAATFALGCQELYDSDIWWHLRTGQWIWEHRQVPRLDPFTFSSADRLWIDLHWLFEILLAKAFAADGTRGMILMAAGTCATVLWVALSARDRRGPAWLAVACWMPALIVMSSRFAPRPELISLLGIAVYLAVLQRSDSTPTLAWVLPFVQVIWVNAHGLFVLGPLILGAYVIDNLTKRTRDRRWWGHLCGAAVAVGLACLANPYGLSGALFPLELFPKITAWGGSYKSEIIEFMDLREFVRKQTVSIAAGNLYNRAECFLLWVLPLSMILPAVWRTSGATRARATGFILAFGLGVILIFSAAIGLPGQGTPVWIVRFGRLAPLGLAAIGIIGGAVLVRSSTRSAILATLGGLATASWVIWLRAYLFGAEPGPSAWLGVPGPGSTTLAWTTALLGIATVILTLRDGGRLFRMILAVAFGYLGLQAIRNANLFGLVGGFVLSANLGEWASQIVAEYPASRPRRVITLGARVLVAGLLLLLILATVSGGVFHATGERRGFGMFASPIAYAHDAARFAGQPGMPEHALVFSLRQAGVYLFHNGPERKVFMDGRLEVPTRATFETYLEVGRLLNTGRPGWDTALRRLGDPLILMDYEANSGAAATLLADPDWRCVFSDPVAAVFLPTRLHALESPYPSIDFVSRHFSDPAWQASLPLPLGLAEGRSLLDLGKAIPHRLGSRRSQRLALSLLACDRFRQSIALDLKAAEPWALLGDACANLALDPAAKLPGPDEPWDPARGLLPSQSAFCYRQALARDPGQIHSLFALYRSFDGRGMNDARAAVAVMMRRAWTEAVGAYLSQDAMLDPDPDRDPIRHPGESEQKPVNPLDSTALDTDGLSRLVLERLRQGKPESATQTLVEADRRGVIPDWSTADRIATSLLLLGRPAEARQVWEKATDPPSVAERSNRIASAAMASMDFSAAAEAYHAALRHNPEMGEAWFGLALLHTQRGDAKEALKACREGLRRPITPAQRTFLHMIETLIESKP